MMRCFRRLNRVYASLAGYFWLPCPMCGEMFGGHEAGDANLWDDVEGRRGSVGCWRHTVDVYPATPELMEAQ
jgi:hypothetical protein